MQCVGLVVVLLAAAVLPAGALGGLSPEQEAWLQSVSYGNRSTDWPPLSTNQSLSLLQNVLAFQKLTENANYPYHQAVEVWYSDKNRSQVVYYDDCGDGAAWTGLHLASLVHQFIVTNETMIMEELWNTLETIDMMIHCTGKAGYIPRFVGLATDPAYAKYYVGYSNGAYNCVAPYDQYVWLGDSSRDMYLGIAFGLANSWAWLHSNATIQNKVQALVEAIVDTLKEDHFWILSPKVQLPVNPVPMFSANWRRLALTVNYDKYKDMEGDYLLDFLLTYTTGMSIGSKYGSSYYVNELTVEGLYVLSVLESDKDRRDALVEKFTEIAVDNSDHLQPGFSAFFLSAFQNTTDFMIPQGVLQGGLYDYPAAPDWDHYVDQSSNTMYMPHHDSEMSDYALMIRDRPPRTYLWQRNPTLLQGGETACCLQRKHLDLILPYWMGRSSRFIKV